MTVAGLEALPQIEANGSQHLPANTRTLKVALAHDYLNQYGGAERVLEELHTLFPSAPVYTSMYWPEKMSATISGLDIRTSFMQRLPLVTRNHKPFLLLYPLAFARFDLSGSQVHISYGSDSRPGSKHIVI